MKKVAKKPVKKAANKPLKKAAKKAAKKPTKKPTKKAAKKPAKKLKPKSRSKPKKKAPKSKKALHSASMAAKIAATAKRAAANAAAACRAEAEAAARRHKEAGRSMASATRLDGVIVSDIMTNHIVDLFMENPDVGIISSLDDGSVAPSTSVAGKKRLRLDSDDDGSETPKQTPKKRTRPTKGQARKSSGPKTVLSPADIKRATKSQMKTAVAASLAGVTDEVAWLIDQQLDTGVVDSSDSLNSWNRSISPMGGGPVAPVAAPFADLDFFSTPAGASSLLGIGNQGLTEPSFGSFDNWGEVLSL